MSILPSFRNFRFLFMAILLFGCTEENKKPHFTEIVKDGNAENAIVMGEKWIKGDDFLACPGEGDNFSNMLYSSFYVQDDDFHIKARLSLKKIAGTTAIFWFFNNHFGFDSTSEKSLYEESDDAVYGHRLFVYSPKRDSLVYLQPALDYIKPDEPFSFEAIRKDSIISFFINDEKITDQPLNFFSLPLKGTIAFRPWKNTMKVYDWSINGSFSELPDPDFVYQAGESGYSCFRLPSIVQTTKGTLLAFAEGRVGNCRDNYDVDIVLKKSFDKGETWTPLQVIWNDSLNTCAYPVPVVDKQSGRIALLMMWNLGEDHWSAIRRRESKDTRRIFLSISEDDGTNWTFPKEITTSVKKPEWDYYGIGSGSGLQLKSPQYKNRMIASAYHSTLKDKVIFRSHFIYSDNGGLDWQIGGISPETGTSEGETAELSNGSLLINMTKRSKKIDKRSVAYSHDGGITMQDQHYDDALFDSTCQASLDSYVDENGKTIILFSNPRHRYAREDLTVQYSKDDGKTWKIGELLFEGYSANSDLLVMNDNTLACLFECGKVWTYDGLVFKKFNLEID